MSDGLMPKAFIVASRDRRPGATDSYLCELPHMNPRAWSWTPLRGRAARFSRTDALYMAKSIRRIWRVPARVEAAP